MCAPIDCRLCRHGFDPEIVHPFPGPKLLSYPAWLLTATGPCFRRFVRIPEFRQNRWVRSATPRRSDCLLDVSLRELPQALFKHFFLGSYLRRKRRSELFVQHPQFVYRQRLKVALLHNDPNHDLICGAIIKRGRSGEIMARLCKLAGNPLLQWDVFSLF